MRNRFDLIGIKGFVPVYCQQNFAIFPREEMVIGRRSSQRFPRAIEWSAYSMELFFSSSDRLRSPAYQCRRNRSWNTLVYHEPFTAFSRNDKCYSNETDLIDVTAAKSANETNLVRSLHCVRTRYSKLLGRVWIWIGACTGLGRGQIARVPLFRELHKWPRALWSGFQVFRFIPVSFAPTFPVTTVNNDLGPSVKLREASIFSLPFLFSP